jgi:hypothetical protein
MVWSALRPLRLLTATAYTSVRTSCVGMPTAGRHQAAADALRGSPQAVPVESVSATTASSGGRSRTRINPTQACAKRSHCRLSSWVELSLAIRTHSAA